MNLGRQIAAVRRSQRDCQMIIMPSILLTVFGTWMAMRGSRSVAIFVWVLAILAMLGAMAYHMDDALKIDL